MDTEAEERDRVGKAVEAKEKLRFAGERVTKEMLGRAVKVVDAERSTLR